MGGHRPQGPNTGELDFAATLDHGFLRHRSYRHGDADEDAHQIEIEFKEGGFELKEENWLGQYGMNITFAGEYERAEKINYSEWYWQNEEARRLFNSDLGPPAAS